MHLALSPLRPAWTCVPPAQQLGGAKALRPGMQTVVAEPLLAWPQATLPVGSCCRGMDSPGVGCMSVSPQPPGVMALGGRGFGRWVGLDDVTGVGVGGGGLLVLVPFQGGGETLELCPPCEARPGSRAHQELTLPATRSEACSPRSYETQMFTLPSLRCSLMAPGLTRTAPPPLMAMAGSLDHAWSPPTLGWAGKMSKPMPDTPEMSDSGG